MHMWLLKVNIERVLIVLLSESIRATWLGYSIDFCYCIVDRYHCAFNRNAHILFFQWQGLFPLIFLWVDVVIFMVTFSFSSLYWPLECTRRWTKEYKHLELLWWLSITDKEKETTFNPADSDYLMNDKMMQKKKV